jgi:hypothetical protein
MDTLWAIVCIARRDPEAALMVVFGLLLLVG